MPGGTNNPSIHYLGVEGATTQWGDHFECEAQWRRIQSERSGEYGPLGAYNFGGCNSHGIRMEGRGWWMDSAANGGENGVWYNEGSRALCVLVGVADDITSQCEQMVRDFANEAVNSRGMAWPLRPHSSYVATSCPGDNLRVVIDRINGNPTQGDGELSAEDRNVIGQWMKDDRELYGKWMQQQSANVMKALGDKLDKIIELLSKK